MDDGSIETFTQKTSQYDFIRFTVADMNGISRGKVVPARNAPGYAVQGPEWWAATIALGPNCEVPMFLRQCIEQHQGNACTVPELSTLHPVPWAGDGGRYKVGSVLCETQWMHDGTRQTACPRYVARKQIEALEEMGYTIFSGTEHEFMLFDKGTKKPLTSGHQFCTTDVTANYESFLFDLDTALAQVGINIKTLQTEYAEGQLEITCTPKYGMQTADESFLFREAVKEIAAQKGLTSCFMSKPAPDVGNGAHFNLSLWDLKKEKNVFYNPEDPDKLSDVCKYFMGGLLKHVTAITAICSPTVNCYRRMHTPWAPDIANWGIEDRMATFRVKNYSSKLTLIENRTPGGSSNPYLVLAVTLAAGMDGIKNKIQPPPMHQQEAPRLPDNLEQALQELEKDTVIVKALGEEFIEWFTQTKREHEVKKFEGFDPKVHDQPWIDREFEEYSQI